MRKVERIDDFLKEVGDYWKKHPDLRFFQVIHGVTNGGKIDTFYMEEEEALELFKNFFKENSSDATNS